MMHADRRPHGDHTEMAHQSPIRINRGHPPGTPALVLVAHHHHRDFISADGPLRVGLSRTASTGRRDDNVKGDITAVPRQKRAELSGVW
jgi:hypothetical protein